MSIRTAPCPHGQCAGQINVPEELARRRLPLHLRSVTTASDVDHLPGRAGPGPNLRLVDRGQS